MLLDELGKGTEVRKGTALAAAVLERLARAPGCKGVFATHLHALRTLVPASEAGDGGLSHWHMEVGPIRAAAEGAAAGGEEEEHEGGGGPGVGGAAPTWRLKRGWCDESLAFEVAAGAGMPRDVLGRAAELLPLVDGALAQRAAAAASGVAAGMGPPAAPAAPPALLPLPPLPDPSSAPPAPPPPPPLHLPTSTIDDGAALLAAAARDALLSPAGADPPSVVVVRRGMAPPPAHASSLPVVYVVRWHDGWFYCGETERLSARLQEHRARRAGGWLEAAYVPVAAAGAGGDGGGGGGKGVARALEALAIRRMADEGLPLWSDRDGR